MRKNIAAKGCVKGCLKNVRKILPKRVAKVFRKGARRIQGASSTRSLAIRRSLLADQFARSRIHA
eukprot:6183335-Pleurochrysis_carterae.AAC.2